MCLTLQHTIAHQVDGPCDTVIWLPELAYVGQAGGAANGLLHALELRNLPEAGVQVHEAHVTDAACGCAFALAIRS